MKKKFRNIVHKIDHKNTWDEENKTSMKKMKEIDDISIQIENKFKIFMLLNSNSYCFVNFNESRDRDLYFSQFHVVFSFLVDCFRFKQQEEAG